MNRNNLIFLTDLTLIPAFIMSVYTGLQLHMAGHMQDMQLRQSAAAAHTFASLLFLALVLLHVSSHRTWYRNLASGRIGKRGMVVLLTAVFAVTAASGVWVQAADTTSIGLLHYKAGILLAVLGLLHIIKRLRILKAMISRRFTTKNGGNE